MVKCPSCSGELPDQSGSCPSCVAARDGSVIATRLLSDLPKTPEDGNQPQKDGGRSPLSFDSIDDARFVPGMMLIDRYRIGGLLGRGGMGEVYRADDLKLGQPVALKFLPEKLNNDGAALARFHREVRIARQVSHRNVCRVYDIGEFRGQHFLSMEYIKGEELSSLLRRIGRLPQDKAVEIARQLCAGLSAAHDLGVLHRDLKPPNVMIDENGNVRITDFGLAALAEELRDNQDIEGTPAYMSPEQLTGKELTVRSDIYSLGLVLYEIFTGKRAFDAPTLPDLLKLRFSETTPTSPSNLVKELDPLVERVIERCLEKEPGKRPASALQVAAALPGGDPLAAALAAGETPSPEMVAAAGEKTGLRPAFAVAYLSAIIVALIAVVLLSSKVNLYESVPFDNPPDALMRREREVTAQLGYADRPVDAAYGMHFDGEYLRYVDENDRSPERWQRLALERPVPAHFWYRESPDYLQPISMTELGDIVRDDSPPADKPGMTGLELDSLGHLRSFYAVPPLTDEGQPPASEPDWNNLFTLAGLDAREFTTAEPQWVPRYAYDTRAAWTGTYPNQPEPQIRVEAAARRGKIVYFSVTEPWSKPQVRQPTTGQKAGAIFVTGLFSLILLGAAWLVRRNLRNGKGDRRGAFRLSVYVAALSLLAWLFRADHVPTVGEATLFSQAIANALFFGGMTWVLYLALEPFVRKRYPATIISWNRVLDGKFRDPLVGRDLLIGIFVGVCTTLLSLFQSMLFFRLGGTPNHTSGSLPNLLGMLSARHSMGQLLGGLQIFLLLSLGTFFLIFLLRALLRREWLAVALFTFVAVAPGLLFGIPLPHVGLNLFGIPLPHVGLNVLYFGFIFFISTRLGLFPLIIAFTIDGILSMQPLTANFSAWYADSSLALLIGLLALAGYAFHTSLAGQPVFRDGLLQD